MKTDRRLLNASNFGILESLRLGKPDDKSRIKIVIFFQAKIYWDKTNYNMVEKIFRKSVEFCNEHDSWKLNVAHVLFMQV